jgi:hypothetical protein
MILFTKTTLFMIVIYEEKEKSDHIPSSFLRLIVRQSRVHSIIFDKVVNQK